MLMHLLRPIWKRKSRHLMLSLEICLAFILVFAICAAAGRYYQLAMQPIGFDYDDVWSIAIQRNSHAEESGGAEVMDPMKRALEALPDVQRVSFASFSPYDMSSWNSEFYLPDSGVSVDTGMMSVGDDFFDVLGMTIEEGRWFSRADDGSQQQPVVINRRMADALFPGESAVGKVIADGSPDNEGRNFFRVTGVFGDFRNGGEYMTPGNFLLSRLTPGAADFYFQSVLVKVSPGTARDFEATLSQRLKQVRSDWSYQIATLDERRASHLATQRVPLIVASVIASFLLVMVAFGLFGVLWQSTTQRIPEIGLRRAVGAHAGDIHRQIVIEQLLLSSLAMSAGVLLLLQLPLTGALGDNLDWPLFGGALVVSMAVIYLLSTLCALYPAWRASRLSPTQALHHE